MLRRSELNSSGSVRGIVVGSYEHGNELAGSIKGCKCLDYLSDNQLLIKDTGPCNWLNINLSPEFMTVFAYFNSNGISGKTFKYLDMG
jgi:hypothetical protein